MLFSREKERFIYSHSTGVAHDISKIIITPGKINNILLISRAYEAQICLESSDQ